MTHLVDRSKVQNLIRSCICKDCKGVLVARYAPGFNMQVDCVNCGPEFSGWESRDKHNQKVNESVYDLKEVEKNYPELRGTGMRIKTLRGNKLAFPEIGQIRKGDKREKKVKGKTVTYPVDLDYFRVIFNEGESEAAEIFLKEYGEQPREIDIRFPTNDIDKFWTSSLVGFLAGGLYAQSDGKHYSYLMDGITGELLVSNWKRVDTGEPMAYDPNEPATYYKDSAGEEQPLFLEPSGLLRVMIPCLERAAYLTVVTTSWNDIETITAMLDGMYDLTGGNLVGLPMKMRRVSEQVSTPGQGGKKVRREKWMIKLEIDPAYAAHRFRELERAIYETPQLQAGPVAELPTGELVQVDDFDFTKYADHTTGEATDIQEGEIVEEESEAKEYTYQDFWGYAVRLGLDEKKELESINSIWKQSKDNPQKAVKALEELAGKES